MNGSIPYDPLRDSDVLFLLHLGDGYAFRNCISVLKPEVGTATMIASPDLIEISFKSRGECSIHKIEIYAKTLDYYKYCICAEPEKVHPEYAFSFAADALFNATKTVDRKDSMTIIWRASLQSHLIIVRNSLDDLSGAASVLTVPLINLPGERYDLSSAYPLTPNVLVKAVDFADVCSDAATLKCSTFQITGEVSAVHFLGVNPSNDAPLRRRFGTQRIVGKAQPETPGTIFEVRVPQTMVKALAKVHNITPGRNHIKFFFVAGRPLKIEMPIADYGLYTICIRDRPPTQIVPETPQINHAPVNQTQVNHAQVNQVRDAQPARIIAITNQAQNVSISGG